jgi:hypothetical protein
VLTGTASFPGIEITDICPDSPLEMTGGYHPVTAIVAFTAKDENPFGTEG